MAVLSSQPPTSAGASSRAPCAGSRHTRATGAERAHRQGAARHPAARVLADLAPPQRRRARAPLAARADRADLPEPSPAAVGGGTMAAMAGSFVVGSTLQTHWCDVAGPLSI